MTCATCAGRVEAALNRLPGVAATVNLADETGGNRFDPRQARPGPAGRGGRAAGYDVPHDRRELAIGGMTCATCAGRVERALAGGSRRRRGPRSTSRPSGHGRGDRGLLRPAALIGAVQRCRL